MNPRGAGFEKKPILSTSGSSYNSYFYFGNTYCNCGVLPRHPAYFQSQFFKYPSRLTATSLTSLSTYIPFANELNWSFPDFKSFKSISRSICWYRHVTLMDDALETSLSLNPLRWVPSIGWFHMAYAFRVQLWNLLVLRPYEKCRYHICNINNNMCEVQIK